MEWYTPPELLLELAERYGPFDLDVAADPRAPIWPLVPHHYTAEDDGLTSPWWGAVWMNPPYGDQLPRWIDRAADQAEKGQVKRITALVPARTDTAWWWRALDSGAAPEFLKGRVNFWRPDGTRGSGAAFPSAVLVWSPFRRPS
ncbi:MAG: DNA N-6-adenine-methyltransferase [Myxococcota bacterium]